MNGEPGESFYRLVPLNPRGTEAWVQFALPDPADSHAAMLRLTMSRTAWVAQSSPPELILSLAAPLPLSPPAPAPAFRPGPGPRP